MRILLLLTLTLLTMAEALSLPSHKLPPQIPLSQSRQMWFQHLNQFIPQTEESVLDQIPSPIASAISMGERLHQWIENINSHRSEKDQIVPFKGVPLNSYPIERPNKYGPKTITQDFKKLWRKLPGSIKKVLFEKKKLTSNIPKDLKEDQFITLSRQIISLYKTAIRWETLIEPSLYTYTHSRYKDVRGFYNLRKLKQKGVLDKNLANYKSLSEDFKHEIWQNLIDICRNGTRPKNSCIEILTQALKENKLVEFKNDYWGVATSNWNSFFEIRQPRIDVEWHHDHPQKMKVPFKNIKDSHISHFLKHNVEDEFRHQDWSLEITYTDKEPPGAFIHRSPLASLQLQPNVKTHVLDGSIIVMDANTDLDEWYSQWLIRHEFGHILRLPDCYFEFYDEEEELVINYQLDTSDLMCSFTGRMNERIYKELKRVYFK